ncbi:conserved hypothetical protein [Psychromonas ingrahamii 37]|uniref:HEAT repeat domain-containing protein n=1 Tax=Psychromonas ingrahamii (strain DSM 17664 / CCUG 51855 / 37) TaxID=357804 RepID=A1SS07_PSYIN|nr:hypothetical protein [Psychromonas ingrahamii]ABM02272.1 conserved hypothetical protein [Psychromonas ingrahamii 37]
MKYFAIAVFIVLIGAVIGTWSNASSTLPAEQLAMKVKAASADLDIAKSQEQSIPLSPVEEEVEDSAFKSAPKEAESILISQKQALQIIDDNLYNAINNQVVDVTAERELLDYLRKTNNEQVYLFIMEKLESTNKGNKSDDRLIEYALSLLAAVDSPRASELFFNVVRQDDWSGSNAIYSVRSSISRLARNNNNNYNSLIQQTFTQVNDENPFLNELAVAIAEDAEIEQVDYLISYVDSPLKNKSAVINQAMHSINKESLVPHITTYISDSSSSSVQNVALNTLANMGQYEAASALIAWSSTQRIEAKKQVESLFTIALARSPSTQRAIEKEILFYEFTSEELKQTIINLSSFFK